MKGRKRHILVATCGLLLAVVVHPANVQDRAGARSLLSGLKSQFPSVELIWADGGDSGEWLVQWVTSLGN